ncbi:MAG: dCMP deaminase family protein [Candidatus Komeilibacteria bacterium]|nr:dCMP deaminase family protein [Candidatus Komeilibacteria bacterium]
MEKNHQLLSWDETFMQMAHLISLRSKDPSTQAGAVLVDPHKIVVGLGYNGWVRGVAEDDFPWEREGDFVTTKYAYVVHAEENAVYNANKDTVDCAVYCTLFPCNECCKTLIQNGIKEVVYASDKYHDEPVWQAARKLLDKAGVKYRQYEPEFMITWQPLKKIES